MQMEKMLNIRGFIGSRMTLELTKACNNVGINPELLDPALFEDIIASARTNVGITEYETIRAIFREKSDYSYVKSHLGVVFQKNLPLISKILSDHLRGAHDVGRPKS
jgi:hypothetical protein